MKNGKANRGASVLIAGSVLQLFLGVIYVWSVFVAHVSEHFVWAIESVKLTSSFMLGFFVLGILLGGKWQAKAGTSIVVLTGGLLMAVGMLITSFIPITSPWVIYISYGIIGGFGVGMAYNAIITASQKWFPHKRGFATGVSVCMFGFSTVVFAPLVETLVASFGLITCFQILAAAFALVTLLFFSFIKLPEEQASAAGTAGGQEQYTTSEVIRTKEFYLIMFSMMFLTASYFIMNPSFKTLAVDRGNTAEVATIIVMMTGIANALGRLLVPVAAGKIGGERAVACIIILTAIATALLMFAEGILFMVCIAVIAFCYGGSSGVYPVITGDYFGLRNLGSNYGAVMVGFAMSALFFPMLFGLIENVVVKFAVLAAVALVGAVMIWILTRIKKKGVQ